MSSDGFTVVSKKKKKGKTIQQRAQTFCGLVDVAKATDPSSQGKNVGAYYVNEECCGVIESGFSGSSVAGTTVLKTGTDKVVRECCVEAKAIKAFKENGGQILWIFTTFPPCPESCQNKIKTFAEANPDVCFAVYHLSNGTMTCYRATDSAKEALRL